MKLKESIHRVLIIYGSLSVGLVLLGGFLNETFLILLGLSISIIGICFANSLSTKQLIYNLKKNNLWDDQIPKKKPVQDDKEAVQP